MDIKRFFISSSKIILSFFVATIFLYQVGCTGQEAGPGVGADLSSEGGQGETSVAEPGGGEGGLEIPPGEGEPSDDDDDNQPPIPPGPSLGNFGVLAEPLPTAPGCKEGEELKDGNCVLGEFPVDGIKLKLQIGKFVDSGSNSTFEIQFCETTNFYDEENCHVGTFNAPYFGLDRGKYVTMDLLGPGVGWDKPMDQLSFPQDFQYWRLWAKGTDGLMVAGLELAVRPQGASDYLTVYRNPCNNRWVDYDKGGGF